MVLETKANSDSLPKGHFRPFAMKSLNRYLLPGGTLLIGIAVGQLTGRPSQESEESRLADRNTRSERADSTRFAERPSRSSAGPTTELQRLRNQIHRATPEQIPALVYRVLEIADPNERQTALCEAIRAANPDQCQAIMNQFVRITRETGRLQYEIWSSALYETGKVGGTTMLDSWKAQGKHGGHKELCESLYGVASQDPQGAMAWLNREDNADLPERGKLLGFVIAGVALTNVAEATRMMNELPIDQRSACLGHFMWNAIQNEGIDSAVDWAITERLQVMDTNPAYAQAIENDIFDRLFSAAEWTGGAPQMAERSAHIHQQSPVPNSRLIHIANRLHSSDGLTLIDHLTKNHVITADDTEVTVRAVHEIANRSPEAVQRWLRENPVSPIRDLVEDSVSGQP